MGDIYEIVKFAPLITAVLGVLTILSSCFNREYDFYIKLENEYFNRILVPRFFRKTVNLFKFIVAIVVILLGSLAFYQINLRALSILELYLNESIIIGNILVVIYAIFDIYAMIAIFIKVIQVIFYKSIKEDDKYINELKYINKQIKNKIEIYNKNFENWYIY